MVAHHMLREPEGVTLGFGWGFLQRRRKTFFHKFLRAPLRMRTPFTYCSEWATMHGQPPDGRGTDPFVYKTCINQNSRFQVPVRQLPENGSRAGRVIVDVAAREGASCIVMGTYSKGGALHGVVNRSTSDYVMHHANCAVLVNRQ